ncbi:MAG: hypothetical protein WC565_09455 [Parcubacteria group bacterium]
MKRLRVLVGIAMALVTILVVAGQPVMADDPLTWEEFCAIYGEMPPGPPCEKNVDVWTDPFNEAPQVRGDYSGGGQSVADMNADAFLDALDWTGNTAWRFT